jgi:hypothetical protein
VPQVSHGFWTLFVGLIVVLPIAVLLRTFSEIKWIRYAVNILLALVSRHHLFVIQFQLLGIRCYRGGRRGLGDRQY